MTRDDASAAVCVDVGSTWTKAVLVRFDGALAGFAEHPTTVADVLAGVDAAVRAVVAAAPGRRNRSYWPVRRSAAACGWRRSAMSA